MSDYTQYSYLTDEELISKVESKSDATQLEIELAIRLQDAIDVAEEADETVEMMADILEEHGVVIETAEGSLQ